MTIKKFLAEFELSTPLVFFDFGNVNLVDGKFFFSVTDYTQKDLGQNFFIGRKYNSAEKFKYPLGRNWAWNISRINKEKKFLELVDENFTRRRFQLNENFCSDNTTQIKIFRSEYQRKEKNGEEFFYGEDGQLKIFKISEGVTRKFFYNGSFLEKIKLASGAEIYVNFKDNKLSEIRDALGRKTSYIYDGELLKEVVYPNRSKISYYYDTNGFLIGCKDRDGVMKFSLVCDEFGKVIEREDYRGKFTFDYEDQNRRTIMTNSADNDKTYFYWNRRGQVEKVVYSDNTDEIFSYNELGKMTYAKNRQNLEEHWDYDASGNLIFEEKRDKTWKKFFYENEKLVEEKNSADGEIYYYYNEQNFLREKRTKLNVKDWDVETWERDSFGRILSHTHNGKTFRYSYEDYSPMPNFLETPAGEKISFRYDEAFRLLVVHDSLGEENFSYSALNLLRSKTDTLGDKKFFKYNLQGNSLDAEERKKVSLEKKISYALDKFDNGGRKIESRKKIYAGGGKFLYALKRWTYDADGNVLIERSWVDCQDEKSATGRVRTIKKFFDLAGRLIRIEDNRGAVIEYEYHNLGFCTQKKYLQDENSVRLMKFKYDAAKNLVEVMVKEDRQRTGKLWSKKIFTSDEERESFFENQTEFEYVAHSENYFYDALGNVIKFSGGKEEINFRRDVWGRVTEVQTAEGRKYFSYDFAGNLREAVDFGGEKMIFDFDLNGNFLGSHGEGNKKLAAAFKKEKPFGSYIQQKILWKIVCPKGKIFGSLQKFFDLYSMFEKLPNYQTEWRDYFAYQ